MIINREGKRVDNNDVEKVINLLHNEHDMTYEDLLIAITDYFDTDDMAQAVNQVLIDNDIDFGWSEE